MTIVELKKLLDQTGYPVAYSHFNNGAPSVPYICYLVDGNPNLLADNKTYHKISDVTIELYTNKKDLVAEGILESLLDENEIPYQPDEVFISSENLFQRIYEVRLI
ncbi:hypothetical protein HLK66_15840 [Niallia circulans]|uniref:hypothetical protein n=1 Tax=Niallia circulans TaxID=1397 RepID=UPI00148FDEA2|nr:hypothetical protein [Niallia circulans]QJX62982.1 hypothetical protein HLK66_15840 [Niallia circulans]